MTSTPEPTPAPNVPSHQVRTGFPPKVCSRKSLVMWYFGTALNHTGTPYESRISTPFWTGPYHGVTKM